MPLAPAVPLAASSSKSILDPIKSLFSGAVKPTAPITPVFPTPNGQPLPTSMSGTGAVGPVPITPTSMTGTGAVGPVAPATFQTQPIPQVQSPTAPAFSASVLAQQKALNAQGAGLKEDGLLGPLTSAAITKYASGGSSSSNTGSPTAPVVPPPAPTALDTAQNADDAALKAYLDSQKPTSDETDTQTALDNITASEKSGYQNTEEQAIPMGFITGEQSAIEKRATNLAEPLNQKLARIQAARTASLDASKFALDRADSAVASAKSAVAPTTVAGGSSLVTKDPVTGKYSTVFTAPKDTTPTASIQEYNFAKTPAGGNYKGTFTEYQQSKSSNGSGLAAGTSPELLAAITAGTIDPNKLNSRTLPIYNAIAQASVNAVGSHASAAGETKAVTDLTSYKSTATRVLGVIDKNLPLVAGLADKVNTSGIPGLDSIIQGVKSYTGNDPDVIKYVNSLKTLRSEYAQMLSKGNAPSESDKSEAAQAIPAGLSSAGYQALGEQLKLEANNIISASDDAISAAKSNGSSSNNDNQPDPNWLKSYNYDADISAAKEAIAQGADPVAVKQRLLTKYKQVDL